MKTNSVIWVDEDDGEEEDEDEAAAHAMTRAVTWEQDEEDEDAEECVPRWCTLTRRREQVTILKPQLCPSAGAERF